MGYDLSPETLQCLIAAVTVVIIYWIKASMDNRVNEIKTILTAINTNISTKISVDAAMQQVINLHPTSERILPHETIGHPADEPNDEDAR